MAPKGHFEIYRPLQSTKSNSDTNYYLLCFFQVEKILDVILSSPGTRIGQASECFVYWKDDRRNDTWGLNFTSPIDAKQFRECCDFSKSSARYLYKNGLRLGSKSSPASPTKQEPQCTCLVSDKQQTKLRSMQNRGKSSDYLLIYLCLVQLIEYPILRILNILFVYFLSIFSR